MSDYPRITNKRVLVTGGAGFIGSNLCEDLLKYDNEVVCLDNFSTGRKENIEDFKDHKNFKLIVGDIRNPEDCRKSVDGVDFVLHEAALGSVPRSIKDPSTTNAVNISGFLNMLISSRDAGIKRFVYAASSSTYGDSESLPKVEDIIGKPLSPYAVTKYVNELYAHVFALNYGMETIGLRYFNVYGRRQDPLGAYAAVIPKFILNMMNLRAPTINGDGTNSRDFTYIDNIIQINHLASTISKPEAVNQIYNAAVGERNNLNQLFSILQRLLGKLDTRINGLQPIYGPSRLGDIPHSHASIDKSISTLLYYPTHNLEKGLEESVPWYWDNLLNINS